MWCLELICFGYGRIAAREMRWMYGLLGNWRHCAYMRWRGGIRRTERASAPGPATGTALHCTALHSGLRCRYGLLACLLLVRGDLHTALPFYNTARWLNLVYATYYCCWMESCTQCLSVSSRALRSAVS